jgi:hypothetical protein
MGARDGAMARVEVITGPERRRRWSAEQKRAIVAASLCVRCAPGKGGKMIRTRAADDFAVIGACRSCAASVLPALLTIPRAKAALGWHWRNP